MNWTPPNIPGLPADLNDRLDRDMDYRLLIHDLLH